MRDIIDFLKASCLTLLALMMIFAIFSWREYNKRLTTRFIWESYWNEVREDEYLLRLVERNARERAIEEKRKEMYKKRAEKCASRIKERR